MPEVAFNPLSDDMEMAPSHGIIPRRFWKGLTLSSIGTGGTRQSSPLFRFMNRYRIGSETLPWNPSGNGLDSLPNRTYGNALKPRQNGSRF